MVFNPEFRIACSDAPLLRFVTISVSVVLKIQQIHLGLFGVFGQSALLQVTA